MEAESDTCRRSRREKRKTKASSALEKIRQSRQSGVKQEDELEATEGLFDYVTEEEYSKIIQERQCDQWIMDDDGTYREHGRELFDEEVSMKSKDASSKSKKISRGVGRPSKDIKNMVLGMGGAKKRPKMGSGKLSVKEDTLLADILSQIDEDKPAHKMKPRHTSSSSSFTPRSTDHTSSSSSSSHVQHSSSSVTPPSHKKRTPSMPFKKVPKVKVERSPSPPTHSTEDMYTDLDPVNLWGDGNYEIQDTYSVRSENAGHLELKEEKVESVPVQQAMEDRHQQEDLTMKAEPMYIPEEAVSASGWETVREELVSHTPPPVTDIEIDGKSLPLKQNDSGDRFLEFYWLDMFEDYYKQPGTVYMFGKVWAEETKGFVSCCVTVRNIERCMYFLPREKMFSKSGSVTDEDVTMQDVYSEFNNKYAEKFRLMRFSSKRVEKKYCFDMPDVPRQSEYLEVRYSADYPAPPSDASGRSFSKVFGTSTSSLERLILSCQLKGPCWLCITNPVLPTQTISWCKKECMADSLSSVGVASEQPPPPPLTILSLSMKTLLNTRTKINEILCVGALVHKDVLLDKPPSTPFQSDVCAIRQPNDRHFPLKFQEYMEKKNVRVEVSPSERGLLAFFLAKVAKLDPDLIIGHNLTSQWLDTLQHRLHSCKVPSWSRIGRLKRQVMPKGRNSSQSLCCGRLLLDVKISARELIRARSYDLPELVSTVLSKSYQPWDEERVLASFGSLESLSGLVSHTMDEAYYSLSLTHELCVLPLAYQITCIVGNTLGKTLHGGRSERNEFLLLHAFTQKDYLPPDKQERHKGPPPSAEDEEGVVVVPGKRNKPTYSGGLVLDPKVGFYNRLILLLDFNSLYPSIIQEYNICFTTIDHAHCVTDEDLANLQLPGESLDPGILPAEIRVLVDRRRQVKQLLKSATTSELRQQYDIRQKALKLTANSMYGCLGFSHSRFYAKPLAAAITGRGRDILMHTKELATKLGLDVIYGDTDSIMIDSGTRDIKEAEATAQKVKQEVNKLYRLLEIDIDGIFKCMLLLKKKKYAAISLINKEGTWVEHRELKGLDIVRRDWCDLAKRAGNYVLDQILAGKDYDVLIESVQAFLTKLSNDVRSNLIDLQEYFITKALTKLPKDYPDKKSLPHVQVAMRMISRNQHVQPGDVIPYIVCEGSESGLSSAQRAFHPSEVTKQQLKVDIQYYLQSQVHAVVSRLCEPVAGLDSAQLAHWLGLDSSLYAKRLVTNTEEEKDNLMPGGVSMENAEPLKVKCSNKECSFITEINEGGPLSCGKCNTKFSYNLLHATLSCALRHYKSKYYRGLLVCEEGHVSRSVTLSLGCGQCGRKVKELYTSGSLYGQLKFFGNLFKGQEHKELWELIEQQLSAEHNAYTHVSLRLLFPKLR